MLQGVQNRRVSSHSHCSFALGPAPVTAAGGLVLSRSERPAVHFVLPAACSHRPPSGAHSAARGSGQQATGPHF